VLCRVVQNAETSKMPEPTLQDMSNPCCPGECAIDLNCGKRNTSASLTVPKFMSMLNLAASLLWLGAAHWFMPELQGQPYYLTWPPCTLFMVGIGLFYVTTFKSLYDAVQGGAPWFVKLLLCIFLVALAFFFTGVLGFYPEQAWGAHPATKMLMTAMCLAIFVYNMFIVLTVMACNAAQAAYYPIAPFVFYQATLVCFLGATVLFDEIFDGVAQHPLHDTYNAVWVFKGGAYLFPMGVLLQELFPVPPPITSVRTQESMDL